MGAFFLPQDDNSGKTIKTNNSVRFNCFFMGVTNPTNYKYFERATAHATLTFAGAVPPKLFLEFIEISNFSTLKTSSVISTLLSFAS